MTAWFYINSNVKEIELNKDLKRRIVDNFLRSSNLTTKNKRNFKMMIQAIKEHNFKQEINDKITKHEKFKHHIEMTDYYCKDDKDDARFMTAWF
jgi:negative regulator of replication initiation